MSGKISGQVWDLDLPHTELFVLLAITDHADHDGRNMFPSIDLLAYKTGYSRSTIIRTLNKLVSRGVLERVSRPGHVSVYNAHLDAAPKKAPRKSTAKRGVKMTRVKLTPVAPGDTPTRVTASAKVIDEPSVEPSDHQKTTVEETLTERQRIIRTLARWNEAKTGQLPNGYARGDMDAIADDYTIAQVEQAILSVGERKPQRPLQYLRSVLATNALAAQTTAAPLAPAAGFWGRDLTHGE